jgi:zinc ribbon protein
MALISCPDCGKSVSDEARLCPFCGLPVARKLRQMREEEEARQTALEDEQRRLAEQQSKARWAMGTTIVVLFLIVAGCISNANTPPPPKQYYFDAGTQSATPGAYPFQASGKIKLTYSCSLNAGKVATAELSLVDLKTSKAVWSKQVKCVSGNYEKPLPEFTDTVQLKASNYDIGTKITGDGTWSVTITQA